MTARMNKQEEEKHFKDKLSAKLKEVITNFILSLISDGRVVRPWDRILNFMFPTYVFKQETSMKTRKYTKTVN